MHSANDVHITHYNHGTSDDHMTMVPTIVTSIMMITVAMVPEMTIVAAVHTMTMMPMMTTVNTLPIMPTTTIVTEVLTVPAMILLTLFTVVFVSTLHISLYISTTLPNIISELCLKNKSTQEIPNKKTIGYLRIIYK